MPPFVMIAIGTLQIVLGLFAYYVRIKRNFFIGYRTERAMASEESWIYANRTFGKFFGIAGALDLSLGVGEGLTAYDHHSHAIIYGINFLFFIFGIIFSIYLTERYLSRRYNNR